MARSAEQPSFDDKSDWARPLNPLSLELETGEITVRGEDRVAKSGMDLVPNNFFTLAPVKTIGWLESEIEAMGGDWFTFCDQSKVNHQPMTLLSDEETNEYEIKFIAEGEAVKRN